MTPFDTTPNAAPSEQTELFSCELQQWSLKEDLAGLELPLFALGTQPVTEKREFRSGKRFVRVFPSAVGAATQFDKDLLLFAASQLIEARNQDLQVSRVVRIRSNTFLQACGRGLGRKSFEAIVEMLRRLASTIIETNVMTGGRMQTRGFTMIESYEIISDHTRIAPRRRQMGAKDDHPEILRVLEFTVTLSEWFYNALLANEVLTLDRRYFDLRSPIHRRLYELARKHCGDQPIWKINIDLLSEKVGSTRERFKFRKEVRDAMQCDPLPDYHLALDRNARPDEVVFYTRDAAHLAKGLQRTNAFAWFESLERPGAVQPPRPRAGAQSSIGLASTPSRITRSAAGLQEALNV